MNWKRLVVLAMIVILIWSITLNIVMIVINGGSLIKKIHWEGTDYPCTQKTFENLIQNSNNLGYNQGLEEGIDSGYSQGANMAATECQNYLRNNKEAICGNNGFLDILGTIIGTLI